jgi:hypothetical protein
MPTATRSAPRKVLQLKVTLLDSKPPIWRRLQVLDNTDLGTLHQIIQITVGWTNSHLHQFIIDNKFYSDPEFELDDVLSERRMTLSSLKLEPKKRFRYEYDFGDDWMHDILVEKVLEPEADGQYPQCITGKRACPPEDCGGVWGYNDLLEALKDAENPEHESMLEWLGDDFDPEAFDVDAVNAQLQSLKS